MIRYVKITFLIALALTNKTALALPFTIASVSGTTLPTTIVPGQTTLALYTIQNNSGKTLTGNYIKYLPANVNITIV